MLSRYYRRHHRLVWLAFALNVAFMLAFTLLMPPFRGTDERAHFDMIHQYQIDLWQRQPEQRLKFVVIGSPVDRNGTLITAGDRLRRLRAEDAPPRSDRPTLFALGRPAIDATDQMGQHPPLYYVGMAEATRFLTFPNRFWSWDRELMLARVFSVLLLAPLALLASEAILALGLARRVGAVAAAFTLLVPQKTLTGATVSNDSLVILLAALSIVAALRYFAGHSRRNAYGAGAAAAALALTKSTGAVVTAWVFAILAIGVFLQWRRGERRDALRVLGLSAFFGAVGAIWYVANLIQYGRPQPHPVRTLHNPVPSSFAKFIPRFFDLISLTFWGQPARRLGVALPWWLSHGLSVFTLLCIVVALVTARSHFRYLVALFVVIAAQAAALLQATWATNRMHSLGLTRYLALQGRYLFPILIPLAVFVAVACWKVGGWFSQRAVTGAAVVLLAIGVGAHLTMEVTMLNGYWQGPALSWSEHLRAVTAWSPFPTVITYTLLVMPAIVLAVGAIALARSAREPGDEPVAA